MRRFAYHRPLPRLLLVGGLTVVLVLATAAPTLAATSGHSLSAPPMAGLLGSLVGTVLGGLSWTVNVAGVVHPEPARRLGQGADPAVVDAQGPGDHAVARRGPRLHRQDRGARRRPGLRVRRRKRDARPLHVARRRDPPAERRCTRQRARGAARATTSRCRSFAS